MKSKFETDRPRGDLLAEHVYTVVFLGEDGLALEEDEVRYIQYETDADLQYAGIDLIVTRAGVETNVDIKSAVNSAGKHKRRGVPLSTFAQEITYLNAAGMVKDGWFIDADKATDVYVFCWIPEVTDELAKATRSGFSSVRSAHDAKVIEIAIITRRKLKEAILREIGGELGCSSVEELDANLRDQASLIRARDNRAQKTLRGGFRFVLSDYLQEEPVNLLVPKQLIKDASFHAYKTLNKGGSPEVHWVVVPW